MTDDSAPRIRSTAGSRSPPATSRQRRSTRDRRTVGPPERFAVHAIRLGGTRRNSAAAPRLTDRGRRVLSPRRDQPAILLRQGRRVDVCVPSVRVAVFRSTMLVGGQCADDDGCRGRYRFGQEDVKTASGLHPRCALKALERRAVLHHPLMSKPDPTGPSADTTRQCRSGRWRPTRPSPAFHVKPPWR